MKFNSRCLVSGLLLTVTAITWFVLMTFPVQSFDCFYHLATGRWIAEHGSIPTVDVFSTTALGKEWITHEWAVQLGMYLSYKLGGINLLVLLKSLWLSALAVLLFQLGRMIGSPVAWQSLLLVLAAPTLAFRAFLRPHVVSYGLLGVLLFILYANVPKDPRRRLISLGVLFMVWANCHSGFVFGLFVLMVWEFFKFINWYVSDTETTMKYPGLPVLVAAITALINPNFYKVFTYPFKFMANSELFGMINELRPIMDPGFQGGWFIPIYFALLVTAIGCALYGLHRGGMRELLLIAVFGYLGFRSVRNAPLAVIVMLPGMFLHGGFLWRSLNKNRSWQRYVPGGVGMMAAVALVVAAGSLLTWTALAHGIPTDSTHRRQFGVGISDLNYPQGSVNYIQTNQVKGNMFNTFAFGGFLLWELYPEPNVFVDGRLFVFLGDIINDYRNAFSGNLSVEQLAEKYDISYMILAYPDGKNGSNQGLYATLSQGDDWIPVYFDDNSSVFLRNNPQNQTLISRDGYRLLNPFKRTLKEIDSCHGHDKSAMLREAERLQQNAPNSSIGPTILARYYTLEQSYQQAIQSYNIVLEQHPENVTLRRELARVLMLVNDHKSAETHWRQVIKEGLSSGFNLMNLGISLHRQNKNDAAIQYYQRARATGYQSAELMNVMGIYYAQKNEMQKAISCWKTGLKLDPDHIQLQRNLARTN